MKQLPPLDYLRKRLEYDPETGVFRWKRAAEECFANPQAAASWNSRRAGKPAGTVNDKGYVCILVDGVTIRAHRLAWAFVHGAWPESEIDHENRQRGDNRIKNLRPADHSQNMCNMGLLDRNTSGVKGVSFSRAKGKFQAYIGKGNAIEWLGTFTDLAAATAARISAEPRVHGEFARAAAA